jgi:hypothetical protein
MHLPSCSQFLARADLLDRVVKLNEEDYQRSDKKDDKIGENVDGGGG